MFSGGIPTPLSWTMNRTVPFGPVWTPRVMTLSSFLQLSRAYLALRIRLMRIWRTFPRSAMTSGAGFSKLRTTVISWRISAPEFIRSESSINWTGGIGSSRPAIVA